MLPNRPAAIRRCQMSRGLWEHKLTFTAPRRMDLVGARKVNRSGESTSCKCDVRWNADVRARHLDRADPRGREPGHCSGTVESIDYAGRTVTIRRQQGNPVTVDVPPNARRFEQITVGSTVTATYYDRVTVRLKPAGEPAIDQTVGAITTPTPGALPGATRTRQRVTTVTITGWSPVDRVVSFIGPNGTSYSRRLLDATDPQIVEGLKAGDRVDVTRTEAMSVSVPPRPPQPPTTSGTASRPRSSSGGTTSSAAI